MAANEIVGGNGENGTLSVRGKDGTPLAELLARDNEAVLGAGNKNRPGRLTMFDAGGRNTINLTTADARIVAGSNGVNGVLSIRGKDGSPLAELLARDNEAVISSGNQNRPGRLTLFNGAGKNTINLTTADARIVAGSNGMNGTLSIRGKDGTPLAELLARDNEAIIAAGNVNRPGRLSLFNQNGNEAVRIEAATGDIVLLNADCAEEFDVVDDAEPGSVMVLDESGRLAISRRRCDTRVAGVVSGAASLRPGIILGRASTGSRRVAVALVGKVYCRADATRSPIRTGDLLTTADTPGHAMRVPKRRGRALGALLGKALAPLPRGRGLIPILVALQ